MGVLATAIDQQLFEQSQTHQGLQADFWGLKNLICFLLNKGSRSLASLTPQTKNQRARAGRQMPQTQLQGWHSHHLTNPPGTAGGQRPEITIQRHREGRKGGLTGGMAHYVNHPPIGSVFLLVSCQ